MAAKAKGAGRAGKAEQAQPLLLTIKQTAKRMGIDVGRAYEAAAAGHIPTIPIGKRRMVPVAALERMLAEAGR